jgi:hypothetical protein
VPRPPRRCLGSRRSFLRGVGACRARRSTRPRPGSLGDPQCRHAGQVSVVLVLRRSRPTASPRSRHTWVARRWGRRPLCAMQWAQGRGTSRTNQLPTVQPAAPMKRTHDGAASMRRSRVGETREGRSELARPVVPTQWGPEALQGGDRETRPSVLPTPPPARAFGASQFDLGPESRVGSVGGLG